MADPGEKPLPGVVARGARADPEARVLDDLMDRYARGEDSALAELYRRAAPRLRGFLTRLAGDPALAEDLTHDTFLRIHRARGSFAAGAPALPWMVAIARNALLDHGRRQAVRRAERQEARGGRKAETPAPASSRGDENLAAKEMLDVVRATLGDLPALQREAFVLLRFEGLSVAEAAHVLGTTEGAVKIRAFRAYEALRAALDHGRRGPR